jgi:hypothetical protein
MVKTVGHSQRDYLPLLTNNYPTKDRFLEGTQNEFLSGTGRNAIYTVELFRLEFQSRCRNEVAGYSYFIVRTNSSPIF